MILARLFDKIYKKEGGIILIDHSGQNLFVVSQTMIIQ